MAPWPQGTGCSCGRAYFSLRCLRDDEEDGLEEEAEDGLEEEAEDGLEDAEELERAEPACRASQVTRLMRACPKCDRHAQTLGNRGRTCSAVLHGEQYIEYERYTCRQQTKKPSDMVSMHYTYRAWCSKGTSWCRGDVVWRGRWGHRSGGRGDHRGLSHHVTIGSSRR